MRYVPSVLVTTTLLVTLVVAPGAAAAPPRATRVPCGTELTTSVRLAADVLCPRGSGLLLAADGIDLNLNGHRIVGPGGGEGMGVFMTAHGVTVRNGTISGWGLGITTAEGSSEAAEPEFAATVGAVRVSDTDTGVEAGPGGSITVRNSNLRENHRGATAIFGGRVRIESSTLERNDTGAFSFDVDADGLVVRGSLVRDNSSAGISCGQDGNYDVSDSTLQRNGTGLDVFECGGIVQNSKFTWNRQHVGGYLVEGDRIDLVCNSYTRDGGPVPFPVQPCPAGRTAPAITGAE